MPTYDFTCPDGHEFEMFYRSIAASPLEVACPVCGKLAVRQMSSGAGLVFKGSGFYITDYGKDGKKDQRTSTARPSKSETRAADAKADSAPAPAAGGESKAADAKPAESKPAASASTPAPAKKAAE